MGAVCRGRERGRAREPTFKRGARLTRCERECGTLTLALVELLAGVVLALAVRALDVRLHAAQPLGMLRRGVGVEAVEEALRVRADGPELVARQVDRDGEVVARRAAVEVLLALPLVGLVHVEHVVREALVDVGTAERFFGQRVPGFLGAGRELLVLLDEEIEDAEDVFLLARPRHRRSARSDGLRGWHGGRWVAAWVATEVTDRSGPSRASCGGKAMPMLAASCAAPAQPAAHF